MNKTDTIERYFTDKVKDEIKVCLSCPLDECEPMAVKCPLRGRGKYIPSTRKGNERAGYSDQYYENVRQSP